MKKELSIVTSLIMGLMVSSFVFTACGEDGEENAGKEYYLSYQDQQILNLDWNAKDKHYYLDIWFQPGLSADSEWYIECDQPWATPVNTHGKLSNYGYTTSEYGGEIRKIVLPYVSSANENYEDRTAHLRLYIPDGIPWSSSKAVVTINQYGYEHYLRAGQEVSFITDRSIAFGSTLTIDNISTIQIMEIDWGDGTKKEILENSTYISSISHYYSSTSDVYTVRVRIGNNDYKNNWHFRIPRYGGVQMIKLGGSGYQNVDPDKYTNVSYNLTSGFNCYQTTLR